MGTFTHVVSEAPLEVGTSCTHPHSSSDGHSLCQQWAHSLTGTLPCLAFCSQDSDLPTLISSLHRSGHLVMPEPQNRCEFQRSGVEIGLGGAGEEPGGQGAKLGLPGARKELPGPQQLSLRASLAATLPLSAQWLWKPPPPAALAGSQGGQRRRRRWQAGGGEAGCPPGLHVMVIVLIPTSRADGGGGSGSTVAAAGVGLEQPRPLLTGADGDRTVRDVQASPRLRNEHLRMACTEHPPTPHT